MPSKFSRRDFIHAGCAAGAITLAPNFLDVAEAGLHMHGTSGFNGGKSQIQSSFVQNGGDYPFLNHMLASQMWSFGDGTGWPVPNTLSANGYPLNSAMTNGGVQTTFQIPSQTERPGNWVVITDGIGTILASGLGTTAVSGIGTQTVVTAAAIGSTTTVTFIISATDATTPITRIAWVHADDANSNDLTDYLAGKIFGAKYLAILRQGGAGVIRFLNWQNGNFTNETTWASRKPTTYFSYGSSTFPSAQFAGQTTSSGNDYSISAGTGPLVDKETWILNFDDAAVTCTSGANAQISWTGHGLVTGSPFCLFNTPGGSAPGGVTTFIAPNAVVFFAIFVDANTIKFATTFANAIGGTAITTSSIGANLRAHATTSTVNVTVSVASSNITFPQAHLLSAGDPVGLAVSGGNLPTNIGIGVEYFAIISSPTVIQLATTKANALVPTPITFTGTVNGTVECIRDITLNVRGMGALPLRSTAANLLDSLNGQTVRSRTFQTHITYCAVTYDADLKCWIKTGADDSKGNVGIGSGAPPEICFLLAKTLGAHPYFVSPILSLDSGGGLTDYMPSLMAYCAANQPSWMIPRFEGYNECWNTISNTNYGTAKTFAHWGITEIVPDNWVGRWGSLLGQAAHIAYGGSVGVGYQILIGVLTSLYTNTGGAAGTNDRLVASQFTTNGPTPPAGYSKTPAYQWCQRICCVQYITPSIYNTGTETTEANTWVANGRSPTDPLLTTYVDSLSGVASGFNLATLLNNYQFIFAWAQGQGVTGGWAGTYKLGMCGYEGGYSPSLDNAGAGNVNDFRVASKYVPDVGKCLTGGTLVNGSTVAGTYNDFTGAGGEFPSCFQLASGTGNGNGNAWSVLDPDIFLSPQPSQWTAIAAYNAH